VSGATSKLKKYIFKLLLSSYNFVYLYIVNQVENCQITPSQSPPKISLFACVQRGGGFTQAGDSERFGREREVLFDTKCRTSCAPACVKPLVRRRPFNLYLICVYRFALTLFYCCHLSTLLLLLFTNVQTFSLWRIYHPTSSILYIYVTTWRNFCPTNSESSTIRKICHPSCTIYNC